jgi:hypothetical protein
LPRVYHPGQLQSPPEPVQAEEANEGAVFPPKKVVDLTGRAFAQHRPFELQSAAVMCHNPPLELGYRRQLSLAQAARFSQHKPSLP